MSKNINKGRRKIKEKFKRIFKITKVTRWKDYEDKKLLEMVNNLGKNNWSIVAENLKNKKEKECRDRYYFLTNKEISRGSWSQE